MADSHLPPVSPLRRFLIHPLEALGAHIVFALVRLLPLDTASALGGWLGRTVGPHLGISRRARRNLERAFPEKSGVEIEAICRGMWDNVGRTLLEFPHLDRMRFHQDDSHVEVVGVEYIDSLRDDGRPGIVFSAHMANWEVLPLSAVHRGLPIHLIYRAPNNPWTERLFRRPHSGKGELLPKGVQGARRALKLLSQGGHLGMLVDQKMNDGIPVPFFGLDAMTAPALARFALKYDCPVIPSQIERIKGARFRITHYPPLSLRRSDDREADVVAIMTEVNALIEGWIRKHPEQWLWLHNRWPD
jgi:KDO2-lipid IV(A) lauroyltransferase